MKEVVSIDTPLVTGTYFFTFAREEISPLFQLVPNWQQRAANRLAVENGVIAEFQGGGYVNLAGQPPGAFYQMRIDVVDDGLATNAVPATLVVILAALAFISAMPALTAYMVERAIDSAVDLVDALPGQAIEDTAAGVKWFGVAAVVVAIVALFSFTT